MCLVHIIQNINVNLAAAFVYCSPHREVWPFLHGLSLVLMTRLYLWSLNIWVSSTLQQTDNVQWGKKKLDHHCSKSFHIK